MLRMQPQAAGLPSQHPALAALVLLTAHGCALNGPDPQGPGFIKILRACALTVVLARPTNINSNMYMKRLGREPEDARAPKASRDLIMMMISMIEFEA